MAPPHAKVATAKRSKVRAGLVKALLPVDERPTTNLIKLACHIEDEMFTRSGLISSEKDYLAKYRQLRFNLVHNTSLAESVRCGDIPTCILVAADVDTLATTEVRVKRSESRKRSADSARSDWRTKRVKAFNVACGLSAEVSDGLMTCERCGSRKTEITAQLQLDSGDEPMTVFFLCVTCGGMGRDDGKS